MPGRSMKSVSRGSISDQFEVSCQCPIPATPQGGARIKVFYAGACYTDLQVTNSGQKRLRSPGIQDTSLFSGLGYEVSGIVDELCETLQQCAVETGDRVIVYPDTNTEKSVQEGCYAEYIVVSDVANVLKVPSGLGLELACLLPCGALRAYAAVQKAKWLLQDKLQSGYQARGVPAHILVVGAGGLGLWTVKMAEYFLSSNDSNVKVIVADTNVDKLNLAKSQGCFDVVHWNETIHEEYILERTRAVCKGGVDVVIDFVSSPRTVNRALKVLKQDGQLLVGGNTKYEVSFCLNSLANKNQSVLGLQHGSRQQLQDLIRIFSQGNLEPPLHKVFPVEEADQVFRKLSNSEIQGRAVLCICEEDCPGSAAEETDSGEVFLPNISD